MFRAIILPIFRSARLCVTACGIMHQYNPAGSLEAEEISYSASRLPADYVVGALYHEL